MDQKPLILIAEDDFEDRLIMSETFKDLGCLDAINIVDDGIQVIDYLEEKGVQDISLIILDLNMPKLNGTDVLRLLQRDQRYAGIKVIIFSTSVNEIEMKNCMALGAREYVTKPVKYTEYVDTCRRFYEISMGSPAAV